MAEPDETEKKRRALDPEFWIVLLFLLFAGFIFLGCFRYKPDARMVPLLIGCGTTILAGMRFYHILHPKSKIGRFKKDSISFEFDAMQKRIESEVLKGTSEITPKEKAVTPRKEKKAVIALVICAAAFLLLGYLVGTFFAIVGSSYYVGFRKKRQLFISLVSMYFIIYVILFRIMGAPEDYGLLLEPILKSLNLI
jgi:hypothetical protein